jgi:hypothetical protein
MKDYEDYDEYNNFQVEEVEEGLCWRTLKEVRIFLGNGFFNY